MKDFFQTLNWIIGILNEESLDYHIGGGFAAHLYGSNRPINDIDIDVHNHDFSKIINHVKDFITFGPARYTDSKWDLDLITLDHFGQEIDISGIENLKIKDSNTNQYITRTFDLKNVETKFYKGLELKVINPFDLVDYKKLLDGNHQKVDVKAVEEYIKNKII